MARPGNYCATPDSEQESWSSQGPLFLPFLHSDTTVASLFLYPSLTPPRSSPPVTPAPNPPLTFRSMSGCQSKH
ncbi:hypothetical protein PoB_007192400 [Plakobranchus ocellatus]|uniref:Uncharacterized protein n=1 Tax=Plakobranchus ocellatus TaxID=259542 RepID=A0AAV4DN82_9GAST|nr:hypothetical protein PoB_007192400 [Plakobranchus ocellatus]